MKPERRGEAQLYSGWSPKDTGGDAEAAGWRLALLTIKVSTAKIALDIDLPLKAALCARTQADAFWLYGK